MTDPWIHVGVVRTVNVSRREVRVAVAPRMDSLLEDARWVHIRFAAPQGGRVEGQPLRCRVERFREHKGLVMLLLGGGVSRDSVAAMKGAEVLLPAESVPEEWDAPLTPAELVGMEVVREDGAAVGRIADAFATGANDVIEVDTPVDTVLLPMIDDLVVEVDADRRVVVVRDIAPYLSPDED